MMVCVSLTLVIPVCLKSCPYFDSVDAVPHPTPSPEPFPGYRTHRVEGLGY